MKIISTRVHGAIDYLWSALLIVSPWLFDFARYQEETWAAVTLGVAAILYSLLTDYEMGAVGALCMRTHLGLDVAAGLLLAASPWLLGFADFVWAPHVASGLAAVVAAAMTRTRVMEHAPLGA